MRIKNARLFPTALTFGRTHEGEWFLSVILKATFRLENRLEPARVAKKTAANSDHRRALRSDETRR
jgi:hypothetical protein